MAKKDGEWMEKKLVGQRFGWTKTEIFIMLSERSGLPRILQSEAC